MTSTIRPLDVLEDVGPLDDFDALYRLFGDRLTRFCAGQIGPGGDAEDAAHEAIMKAWASRERFDTARPLWPWLATIARNVCIDHQRHAAVARSRVQPSEPSALGPEDLVMRQAHRGLVRDAIQDLTPGAREVLLLHFVDELDYAEIAARQHRSQGAIRTAVARARSDLRHRVEALARSRGAWPLAAFTGGVGPRGGGRLSRLRNAAQRRTADLSIRTSAALDNLAQCADGFPARVVVGGVLAVAAVVHQEAASDQPMMPDPAVIEVRSAAADPGARQQLDRPPVVRQAGEDADQPSSTVPVDLPAAPLAPPAVDTEIGGVRPPTLLVDEGVAPTLPKAVQGPGGVESPPTTITVESPLEPDPPVPEGGDPLG
ncbi:MAG: RNA polymerase sigma factor [Acidimicrobiales bacterium]